jgi:uncharacterized protein Yka (UPF0111/DUF47 family)
MKFRDIFKPKPNKFMIMLVEQTEITVKGLDLLTHYLKKRSSNAAKEIVATEGQAVEMRRIMIEELMNTFVTPFDREDIFALSRDFDEILRYSSTTVEEMEIWMSLPHRKCKRWLTCWQKPRKNCIWPFYG